MISKRIQINDWMKSEGDRCYDRTINQRDRDSEENWNRNSGNEKHKRQIKNLVWSLTNSQGQGEDWISVLNTRLKNTYTQT